MVYGMIAALLGLHTEGDELWTRFSALAIYLVSLWQRVLYSYPYFGQPREF